MKSGMGGCLGNTRLLKRRPGRYGMRGRIAGSPGFFYILSSSFSSMNRTSRSILAFERIFRSRL
jgi:hypothetical protein